VETGEEGAGLRIREARLAHGWTHEELARRMGVNWRTVQRWQKGRLPRVETLRRLAAVLNVPPSYLLESHDEPVTLTELRDRLGELTQRLEHLTNVVTSLAEARSREDRSPG
jgi:transcriptional regulator with XRE-family HTH domain